MFCSSCGLKSEEGAGFCSQCGAALNSVIGPPAPQRQLDSQAQPQRPVSGSENLPKNDPVVLAQKAVSSLAASIGATTAAIQGSDAIDRLSRSLLNPVFFILGYTVLMIPTYVLPYLGSNSSIVNAVGKAAGAGFNPALWFHVGALAGLVLISWLRGKLIGKSWLGTLPFAALLFDLLPGLSLIPMVPTVFHVLTIVLGVKDDTKK